MNSSTTFSLLARCLHNTFPNHIIMPLDDFIFPMTVSFSAWHERWNFLSLSLSLTVTNDLLDTGKGVLQDKDHNVRDGCFSHSNKKSIVSLLDKNMSRFKSKVRLKLKSLYKNPHCPDPCVFRYLALLWEINLEKASFKKRPRQREDSFLIPTWSNSVPHT